MKRTTKTALVFIGAIAFSGVGLGGCNLLDPVLVPVSLANKRAAARIEHRVLAPSVDRGCAQMWKRCAPAILDHACADVENKSRCANRWVRAFESAAPSARERFVEQHRCPRETIRAGKERCPASAGERAPTPPAIKDALER